MSIHVPMKFCSKLRCEVGVKPPRQKCHLGICIFGRIKYPLELQLGNHPIPLKLALQTPYPGCRRHVSVAFWLDEIMRPKGQSKITTDSSDHRDAGPLPLPKRMLKRGSESGISSDEDTISSAMRWLGLVTNIAVSIYEAPALCQDLLAPHDAYLLAQTGLVHQKSVTVMFSRTCSCAPWDIGTWCNVYERYVPRFCLLGASRYIPHTCLGTVESR